MVEIPETPVSGVANCHAEGVYSFVFSNTLRMFACLNWTGLAANEYGDVVGFHDHHRSLTLEVAFGEVENIGIHMVDSDNGTKPYRMWEWDSTLRGGAGRFTDCGIVLCSGSRTCTTLTQRSPAFNLHWSALHTVKQVTKKVAWFVREDPDSSQVGLTQNWSRNDLSHWHEQADFYKPLQGGELIDVWNDVRGLSINARKRNGK
jgi:hypothetical protein